MPRRAAAAGPGPFLKWAGGKAQLLTQFEPLYPPGLVVSRYVEPFVGGGAVYFDVKERLRPRHAILADGNAALIDAYRGVRDQVEAVIRHLRRHAAAHCERRYYEVRSSRPERLSPAARAARLIYLNKTCYNGLYRVNSRGEFNVPIGRYVNPPILDELSLRAAAEALAGTELKAAHFSEAVSYARAGDFVYCDPPYHPLSATALFTSYTEGAFGPADQEELARVARALHAKGCLVMLSNSECDFVRDLYRDPAFRIHVVHARRSINSMAERRGRIPELVILNYDPERLRAAPRFRGSRRARRRPSPIAAP